MSFDSGKQRECPIFLFGMPRSGTTWIGKIFDSHPLTLYRHEPDSWSPISAVPLVPRVEDAPLYFSLLRRFVASVAAMNVPKVCAKTPVFKKAYQSTPAFEIQRVGALAAKIGGKVVPGFPVVGASRRIHGEMRLVWKSIESLARLGVLIETFPAARAIHIIRHPCGYVSSVLRGEQRSHFEDNSGSSEDYGIYHLLLDTDLAKNHSLDLGYLSSLTAVERLAWRWLLFNEKAIADCAKTDRALVVCYDDLCADPIGITRSMFDFAGLGWAPETQKFLGASTGSDDGAYYGVFKNSRLAASRWERDLSEEDQHRIIAIAEKGAAWRHVGLDSPDLCLATLNAEPSTER